MNQVFASLNKANDKGAAKVRLGEHCTWIKRFEVKYLNKKIISKENNAYHMFMNLIQSLIILNFQLYVCLYIAIVETWL